MDDETSYFHTRGDELLEHLGRHLVEDEVWRGRLEARLGEAVSFFVNTYGSELAEVISVTVDRWDGQEAAERIELHVGRDLQFIRINGTVVGALAGLGIHALPRSPADPTRRRAQRRLGGRGRNMLVRSMYSG